MCSSALLTSVRKGSGLKPADIAKHALATGTALAVIVTAVPASAQRVAGDDPPIAQSGITTVSAVNGRGWRIEGSLRTLFDDNLLRLPEGSALNGRDKADFRISPAVSGAIGLPVGRQQLFLGALYGRDFYVRNSELNRNRIVVGGGLAWRVGVSCSGTIAAEYRRRQNLFSDQSVLVDNVQATKTYGANGDCQAPVGLGFGGSINRTETENKNPNRRAFDSTTMTYSPRLSYGSSALGRFNVSGTLTKVDYPQRTVPTPNGVQSDGVDIMSGRFGYSRALGTRFNLSLGASYIKTKPQPKTVLQLVPVGGGLFQVAAVDRAGYSGLGYDASLSYTPSPRLSAQFSASRDVSSTANVGALFVLNQSYGIDLGYRLGPSISTGLGATFFKRSYRGSFPSQTETVARISDKTSRFYARVGYSPVKLYDLDLEVAHQKRRSNPDDFNFSGTSASLTLRVKFGRT